MTTPTLLHMTAPLREDFSIPYHEFGPPASRPKLALVAGLHGNEVNGIFVLSRLAEVMCRLSEGRAAGVAPEAGVGRRAARQRAQRHLRALAFGGISAPNLRWAAERTGAHRSGPRRARGSRARCQHAQPALAVRQDRHQPHVSRL